MKRRLPIPALVALAVLVSVGLTSAQSLATGSAQSPSAQPTPQSQVISQTGLLPLFAVDMDLDPSWVDGDAFPSTSPQFSHNGVSDVLDQVWTTLKPAGFNAIRFPVHLDDAKSPIRLANLCLWANANGLRLIPVLQASEGMRKSSSVMTDAVSKLIKGLVSNLKGVASAGIASYAQISFYQLERSMNHVDLYPGMTSATAQQFLLVSSAALRQSETQALQGTGVQGTPISISASFDFELIRQGAIAGVPLDPNGEQRSEDSLKDFLKGASSQNIDAINLEWFPRSISSGDVDHFVTLLGVLKQTFPDKEITLTTGFSSAFNPPDQALQFYAAAISNLGNYRVSDGTDSKFVGVVFEQAFKGKNADAPAPAGTSDPSQWKWSDKAQQLWAMWSQGTPSADMTWWTSKVQDNTGLIALNTTAGSPPSAAALPTLGVLQEIASTLNQATQQLPATSVNTSAPLPTTGTIPNNNFATTPSPGYVPGAQPSSQAAASPFQQLLFTLLQQFSQQIAAKLMTKFDGSNAQARYTNPANPDLAPVSAGTMSSGFSAPSSTPAPAARSSIANTIWIGPSDVNVSTTSPAVGQSVVVSAQVHNQSSDQDIGGLTFELVNPANSAPTSQSVQSGVTVPHSGVTPVQLTWVPDATTLGDNQLVLQALDSSGQTVTTVAIPKITVQGGAGATNSPVAGNAAGSTTNTSVIPGASAGFMANTPASNGPGTSTITTGSPSGATTSSTIGPGPGSTPNATPMSQLTVTSFSFADQNSSAAGQIPQLLAQVSNPSQVPTQSGQAQLFLDGAPQQMQTIASILPSGTLILQFSAMQASIGQHNLQLVVTMSDGANASSTLAANVTAAAATTQTGAPVTNRPAQINYRPSTPRSVRPVVPTVFQIGNVTPSSPSGGTSKTQVATSTPASQVANPQSQLSAPPATNGAVLSAPSPQRSFVRTIAPSTPVMASAGTQSIATPRTPTVRTIVPASPSGGTPSSTSPSVQSTPAGTTNASPVATRTISGGAVRTITPTTSSGLPSGTSVTPSTSANGNVASSTTTARTIVPAAPRPSTGVASISSIAQPNAVAPAGVRPTMAGGLDLSIASQDVTLLPISPKPGQTAMFTAAVKNSGSVAAQGARVLFILAANGQRLAVSQPMVLNVPAHGMVQARWSAAIPAAAEVQITVSVMATGDMNLANNQVVVPFLLAVTPSKVLSKTH